jgi:hypothetical protein
MPRAKALLVLLLACGTALLVVPGTAQAAKPCWEQVIDDWSLDGNIDGRYPARCIAEALENVPEDIRAYSDFEEQAKAARLAAGRTLQNAGGSDGGGGSDGSVAGEDTQMVQERNPDTGPKDESPVGWALQTNGNNADSIPIPLLILLGLSAALLAAGGAGLAARKIRARRPGAPS